MGQERRKSPRLPIAADLAEPMELTVFETVGQKGAAAKFKAKQVPTILTNISSGGMALIAFGAKETFKQSTKIQMVFDLPGLAKAKINGKIVHVESKKEMQTLGVKFLNLAQTLKNKITKMANDYMDCESRLAFNVPDVCIGQSCHYFGLCKKPQKLPL